MSEWVPMVWRREENWLVENFKEEMKVKDYK